MTVKSTCPSCGEDVLAVDPRTVPLVKIGECVVCFKPAEDEGLVLVRPCPIDEDQAPYLVHPRHRAAWEHFAPTLVEVGS